MHISAAQILIPSGLFFTLVYAIIALYEIYKYDKITLDEKLMWTVGFYISMYNYWTFIFNHGQTKNIA